MGCVVSVGEEQMHEILCAAVAQSGVSEDEQAGLFENQLADGGRCIRLQAGGNAFGAYAMTR